MESTTPLEAQATQRPLPPASPWRPLHNRVFRDLLAASLVFDIGAFMQAVGAAWLMVSPGAGPFHVALIQAATILPFFLLVLPAGAPGDIMNRRRLILVTGTRILVSAQDERSVRADRPVGEAVHRSARETPTVRHFLLREPGIL